MAFVYKETCGVRLHCELSSFSVYCVSLLVLYICTHVLLYVTICHNDLAPFLHPTQNAAFLYGLGMVYFHYNAFQW